MKEPTEYMEQVFETIGARADEQTGKLNLSFSYDTVDETKLVKKEVIMYQKRLRAIKRDINADLKEIRQHFKSETDSVED